MTPRWHFGDVFSMGGGVSTCWMIVEPDHVRQVWHVLALNVSRRHMTYFTDQIMLERAVRFNA
jgi:hypothetical protein